MIVVWIWQINAIMHSDEEQYLDRLKYGLLMNLLMVILDVIISNIDWLLHHLLY